MGNSILHLLLWVNTKFWVTQWKCYQTWKPNVQIQWQVYTYSKDAETGLCNRHQQVEIINMIVVDQMNHQKSLSGGDSEVQRLPEDGARNGGGGED